LWPEDEPWPVCHDHDDAEEAIPASMIRLVPVMQLRAKDFPELAFYPGTDLLQVLWCALDEHDPPIYSSPKAYVFWRHSKKVSKPRKSMPRPDESARDEELVPRACQVFPERVTEYPPFDELPEKWQAKLRVWAVSDALDEHMHDAATLYEWHLSVCPGTKIAGYPNWQQRPEDPVCTCGRRMEHLLTLSPSEFGPSTAARWCPEEDQAFWQRSSPDNEKDYKKRMKLMGPLNIDGLGAMEYVFICRSCEGWPTQAVVQR
jgi:hypothetical protein